MKKKLFLIFILGLILNSSFPQKRVQYISIYGFLNKSYSLPLDSKIRNRPDYLKQYDNLNESFQLFYGMPFLKKHSFILGFAYENRFSYSDKFHYSDYCLSQVKEFTKVYVRNINSIAFTFGASFIPINKFSNFNIGAYLNFGLTVKSWYKELVEGNCPENGNYYEDSNNNIFYSSNIILQYNIINSDRITLGFVGKVSHRSYRFFFSDFNFGGGINLKYNLISK